MISLTLIKAKIMSFFDYALKRVESATKTTVTCPICGFNSNHPTTKVRQEQALLCPKCKSLFVIHR
ncbi:YnfU family zinc-binding protein [Lelliottia amnigena]|uniref:YnfU family zinc-binding protein n=2 Tax=Lelliottia amnigena TaxID=61646 RepID=UPI00293BAB1C|nr:YnfU family zinc-binding protein [Lelliottia amnigena]